MLKPIAILYVITTLLTISCKKDHPYWDVDVVGPLAQSTLKLNKLFPDSVLKSNKDSSLKIAFESKIMDFTVDSLFNIPDTTLTSYYSPIVWAGGYFTYNPNDVFPIASPNTDMEFAISTVELNQIKILKGKMRLKVESVMKQPTIFNCLLSSAKKNGQVLNINIPTPAATYLKNDTIPGIADTLIDLSGYDIDMSGSGGNKTNTIFYTLKLIIAPYAQTDSLKKGDYIKTNISFIHIIPQYGQGYFGNQTIYVGPDTNSFHAFSNFKTGILNLSNASMQLKVINEFGVDMKAKINEVSAINSFTGSHIVLSGPSLASSFNVNRATKTGIPSVPINSSTKTLFINDKNSNIVPFMNVMPNNLGYNFSAQLNPNGNQSGMNDFVYYGTSLKAYLNVDIPLNFSAGNLSLIDTVGFNYSSTTQLDNVNYGNLLLYANNGYPMSMLVQGYLLDENGIKIDSLFADNSQNTISSADIGTDNKVINSKKSELKIPLNKNKIVNIKRARKVCFVSKFNTTNQPSTIKFYNYYSLDLTLTIDVNYSVNK